MSDPGSLLATLAQSSAAVVAIVGGFLVSRLVQLSSEREGLRRQLVHTRDELTHVTKDYDEAHGYRLVNSQRTFTDWVLEDLVAADPDTLDRDAMLASNLPRGASIQEMSDHLDVLVAVIAEVKHELISFLGGRSPHGVYVDDLQKAGLVVPGDRVEIYEEVLRWLRTQHRGPYDAIGVRGLADIRPVNQVAESVAMRRLDDSIRDEQDLYSRRLILDAAVIRTLTEIDRIGRPAGVTSAIAILAIYSILGIVAPVVVMGVAPVRLANWEEWALIGAFVVGLFAVLGYIWWYASTLNDPVATDDESG